MSFHVLYREIVAPGNLLGLLGDDNKRRGGAGPAWAEAVAAELAGFNQGPDLPLAPL